MTTAFGARLHMVHIDERRVGAARHAATVSIAREHRPSQRRWDALLRARAGMSVSSGGSRAHVGVV